MLRNWRQRCIRARAELAELKQELARHTESKQAGGRVAQEWIARVVACAPHSSARALEQALHLGAGSDTTIISRWSVGNVRSAWCEMHEAMVQRHCRAVVEKAVVEARRCGTTFVPVLLLQVQDEAELRLLSTDARDGPTVPKRGRASKVQVNVATLLVGDTHIALPQELQALGNKLAVTLATCFDILLRRLVPAVLPGSGAAATAVPASGAAAGPPVWFVHVLVGDGIGTNEAAAKQLWANGLRRPFVPNGRYFLAVVKCGNHQAALSASFAVVGPPAKAMGEAWEDVTANATRLYKYLLVSYYEDFVSSTQTWSRAHFADRPEVFSTMEQADNLQQLYTVARCAAQRLGTFCCVGGPRGGRARGSRRPLVDVLGEALVGARRAPDFDEIFYLSGLR